MLKIEQVRLEAVGIGFAKQENFSWLFLVTLWFKIHAEGDYIVIAHARHHFTVINETRMSRQNKVKDVLGRFSNSGWHCDHLVEKEGIAGVEQQSALGRFGCIRFYSAIGSIDDG